MFCLGDMHFGTDVFFDDPVKANEFVQHANNGITGEGEYFYQMAFDVRKDLTAEDELWRVIIHTLDGIIDTDIIAYKDGIEIDSIKGHLNAQTILTEKQANELMQNSTGVFKDQYGCSFIEKGAPVQH